jgi:hypothetical protein
MSLTQEITDDLAGVGYDPDNYEAPKPLTALPKGTYRAKLTRWQEDTDRSTGQLKNPYTLLTNFEVTEGPQAGRFVSFQRISSVQFKTRNGASMLNDLIAILAKATNTEGAVKGRDAIKQLFDLARDTNASLSIRTDWEAYDKDFINQIKEAGNTPSNEDYKTARISGQKNFTENGTVVGESGTELTAQAVVKGFGV